MTRAVIGSNEPQPRLVCTSAHDPQDAVLARAAALQEARLAVLQRRCAELERALANIEPKETTP